MIGCTIEYYCHAEPREQMHGPISRSGCLTNGKRVTKRNRSCMQRKNNQLRGLQWPQVLVAVLCMRCVLSVCQPTPPPLSDAQMLYYFIISRRLRAVAIYVIKQHLSEHDVNETDGQTTHIKRLSVLLKLRF